jgi:hypothetical protein
MGALRARLFLTAPPQVLSHPWGLRSYAQMAFGEIKQRRIRTGRSKRESSSCGFMPQTFGFACQHLGLMFQFFLLRAPVAQKVLIDLCRGLNSWQPPDFSRLTSFPHKSRCGRAHRRQGRGEEYLPWRPVHRQQGTSERRPDAGPKAANARSPSHTCGTDRRRIETRGEAVQSGLSALD